MPNGWFCVSAVTRDLESHVTPLDNGRILGTGISVFVLCQCCVYEIHA
jgi:hypothetical protein